MDHICILDRALITFNSELTPGVFKQTIDPLSEYFTVKMIRAVIYLKSSTRRPNLNPNSVRTASLCGICTTVSKQWDVECTEEWYDHKLNKVVKNGKKFLWGWWASGSRPTTRHSKGRKTLHWSTKRET
ncbi:hypothetical protein ACJMK2_028560 [Sinanodonta woodiana]|uniref:Uncharacterized protein n=1 Tax=Sinanodonta woodiana TaxID=1069815 RepID=A0ABD3X803_SINWO